MPPRCRGTSAECRAGKLPSAANAMTDRALEVTVQEIEQGERAAPQRQLGERRAFVDVGGELCLSKRG